MTRARQLLISALLASSSLLGSPALAGPVDSRADAVRLFRAQKYAEAAQVYGELAKSNPYDGDAWGNWGYCLHAIKKYDDAIPAYLKAIELGQNVPSNTYNLACAQALKGNKDESLKWLEKALSARFAEQQPLATDTDLDSLRSDPRFAALTGLTKDLKAPVAATRDARWAWDLDFYARRMKQMHYSLYTKVSESAFRAEIERLKKDIPSLTDDQARARLRIITATVGDGHTQSTLLPEGATTQARLPLHMFAFKDGLYIMGAGKDQTALVGCKVLKFGPLDTAAAMNAVRPYISVDNDMGYLASGPAFLCNPIILAAIGAAKDQSGVELTISTRDGKESKVTVSPVDTPTQRHAGRLFTPGFTYAHESSKAALPLYIKDTSKIHRMEYDSEHKLVYYWFGAVQDSPEDKLGDFAKKLFEFIETNGAEHLVIDMRFNGGGNTGLIQPLINALIACKAVNRPGGGHLWVIIGRHTFSAAQNTVNLIDANTAATFVGEPTGSRPHFIGESTYFILPHSKTRVYCSSRYWQYMDSTDDRCWVAPAIVAEMTFADYANNRDPAMDAILEAIGGRGK